MELGDPPSYNFDNIEKVAAFIITADGLGISEKIKELHLAGYQDSEIDIGTKMALQACLMVTFSRTMDATGISLWKKPPDFLA